MQDGLQAELERTSRSWVKLLGFSTLKSYLTATSQDIFNNEASRNTTRLDQINWWGELKAAKEALAIQKQEAAAAAAALEERWRQRFEELGATEACASFAVDEICTSSMSSISTLWCFFLCHEMSSAISAVFLNIVTDLKNRLLCHELWRMTYTTIVFSCWRHWRKPWKKMTLRRRRCQQCLCFQQLLCSINHLPKIEKISVSRFEQESTSSPPKHNRRVILSCHQTSAEHFWTDIVDRFRLHMLHSHVNVGHTHHTLTQVAHTLYREKCRCRSTCFFCVQTLSDWGYSIVGFLGFEEIAQISRLFHHDMIQIMCIELNRWMVDMW